MRSPAFPSPRRKELVAVLGSFAAVVIALGAGVARAQSADATGAPPSSIARRVADPYAERFPNVVLKTHEGKNVRLYDDLLKGKIVMVNFMYATCTER